MIRAPQDRLTLDDLERLAFLYGGEIRRDIPTDTYRLVGAVMAGRRVDLGPVRNDGTDVLAARVRAVAGGAVGS